MAIPAFEPSGYLPAGRHVATPAEMHEALVAPFPTSTRRAGIFAWWQRHRSALEFLTTVVRQWIGGSFVSTKLDPADIDVCTFMDGPTVDALSTEQQDLIRFMTSGKVAQGFWNCDSYAVVEYPAGHPNHGAFLAAAAYWNDWWGNSRPGADGSQTPRGYVELS